MRGNISYRNLPPGAHAPSPLAPYAWRYWYWSY